jgi:hypothetical protein
MPEDIPHNKTPKQKNVHMLETYGEDMANYISLDKEGLVQQIIHEQEKLEAEAENASPFSKQNGFLLFLSMLFLVASVGLIGYYFFVYTKDQTVVTTLPFKSIINTDSTVFLDVTGLKPEEVGRIITKQKEVTKIHKGKLEAVYLTENKKVIGFSRFLALIKSSLQVVETPVISDNFLFGIISFEKILPANTVPPDGVTATNETVDIPVSDIQSEIQVDPLRYAPEAPTRKDEFMLLTVASFADVFPVLRSWEHSIFSELYKTFDITLSVRTNYLVTKEWQDGIVQNKNARILYDNEGNIMLMYVFVDDTHVLFSNTEQAVGEIIERLAASKVSK